MILKHQVHPLHGISAGKESPSVVKPKGSDSIESENLLLAAMTKTSPIKKLTTILHHLKIKHMTQMGQNV